MLCAYRLLDVCTIEQVLRQKRHDLYLMLHLLRNWFLDGSHQ